MRSVHRGGGTADETEVPESARPIFDGIVGDSVRRRLRLMERVFSSDVFHQRWQRQRLSGFYFLDALIRADKNVFDPSGSDNPT